MGNGWSYDPSQFSLAPGVGGGGLGMSFNPFSMNAAAAGGGGGLGGWLTQAGNFLGGPAGLPISIGMQFLGGVLGALAQGQKTKKKKQMRNDYITQANKLFPELGKETFQYQDPEVANLLRGMMGNRLQTMFPSWGMPAGMSGYNPGMMNLFQQAIGSPAYPQSGGGSGWQQAAMNNRT